MFQLKHLLKHGPPQVTGLSATTPGSTTDLIYHGLQIQISQILTTTISIEVQQMDLL